MRNFQSTVPARLLALAITILLFFRSIGQPLPAPQFPSPNVTSMEQHGKVPVGLFTGTPDVTIPIYSLGYGNISIPIALKYHSGSVRPAQHPGWVGLGWSLQAFGSISRTVRGDNGKRLDEACCITGSGSFPAYYPEGSSWSGSQRIDGANWAHPDSLDEYISTPGGRAVPDVEADEFSYSILGHSGKFFYGGPSKGWQVVSDEQVKVELNGFFTANEISSYIYDFSPHVNISGFIMSGNYQPRAFKGFTITTPDGMKFIFGGAGATEFSTAYQKGNLDFVRADGWLIKQIIDVNSNVIDFEYKKNYLTAYLSFGHTNTGFSGRTPGGMTTVCGTSWSQGNINAKERSGRLQWPLYLTKIQCNTGSVNFESAPATCLRYSDLQLNYANELSAIPNPAEMFNQAYLGTPPAPTISHIQWEQLNKIVVKKANQEVYRVYQFTYNNSPTERLTLNRLEEKDKLEVTVKKYEFAYLGIADLPLYDGNKTDHWGYYNGVENHQQFLSGISNLKATNITEVNKGLLSRITYPTKGFTDFIWEAHDYARAVSTDRNSLLNLTGFAGGGRIREIKSYTSTGELAHHKKYFYKKNYNGLAGVGALQSTGILNGLPRYVFDIVDRPSLTGQVLVTYHLESLNSLANLTHNSEGFHIGYDEVVEVDADGSYTKHFFTSYGTDLNGISHYDNQPDSKIGWNHSEDQFHPRSSLSSERGKPIGTFLYQPDNTLVEKTILTYRNDPARFNEFVKQIDFRYSISCVGYDALIFASAYRAYRYAYYPIKKEVTRYDHRGQNPMVSTISYTYNASNIITEQTEFTSDNVPIRTRYKYPPDFPSATIYQNMTNAWRLTDVVEESKIKNEFTEVSLKRVNYYSPYTGIYVPQSQELKLGTGPQQVKQLFNEYDSKGNIREMQNADDVKVVFLWGYNSQYPVAKIVGSSYAVVSGLVSQTLLDDAGNQSDATIRNALNALRTSLPSAHVTTYTYSMLTGMTSETDPRGKSVYYEYDGFQRLKLIKDQDGNITKTFNYQFKP